MSTQSQLDPNESSRLQGLFSEALVADQEARAQLLESLAKTNATLAQKLEHLLLSYHRFDTLVEQGEVEDPLQSGSLWEQASLEHHAPQSNAADSPPPDQVGPYQLESELGQGGSARVFLAMQASPRRKVALKLIPNTVHDGHFLDRFRDEYEALALMRHPNIATVFDVGYTPDHDAWIAMEYVPGMDLCSFCRHQKLSLKQRIDLFIQVLNGVNHAHQQAVIHRDLKPSNILAFRLDGTNMAKIIDFGLARGLYQPQNGAWAPVAGTLAYMAPELLTASGNKSPNVAADIYALGIIFHELMMDRHPFDLEALAKLSRMEAIGYLRETRPQPSAELTRDLAWIFAKAVAPLAENRYASVSQFKDDLGHFLNHRPVLAAPANRLYLFKKLVRRHRQLFAMLTLILLGLVAGFTQILISRNQAITARQKYQAVNTFLTEMLASPGPKQLGWDVRVTDVLATAEKRLENGELDDPALIFELRTTLGNTYDGLGLNEQASKHLEQALDLAKTRFPRDDERLAGTYDLLAKVKRRQGSYQQAEAHALEAIRLWSKAYGKESRQALKARARLIMTWNASGAQERAQAAYVELLDFQTRRLGPLHPDTLITRVGLGTSLARRDPAKAADYFKSALEGQRKILGAQDPATLSCEYSLAMCLLRQGRFQQAEVLLVKNLAAREKVLGPTYPYTLSSRNGLGTVYERQGKHEQAIITWRELLDTYQKMEGPPPTAVLLSMNQLAGLLHRCGRKIEALDIYRELLDLCDKYRVSEANVALRARQNMGNLALEMGLFEMADFHLSLCLEIKQAIKGPMAYTTLITRLTLVQLDEKRGYSTLALKGYNQMAADARAHFPGSTLARESESLYERCCNRQAR